MRILMFAILMPGGRRVWEDCILLLRCILQVACMRQYAKDCLTRRIRAAGVLPAAEFQSLTAHAADPDSNLIITLTTEGLFQFR